MKNKYRVVIHYEGAWNFEIEAADEEQAQELAETQFAELGADELINNLADVITCDCWEVN